MLGSSIAPVRAGRLGHEPVLLGEPTPAGGRRRPAFERQRRVRDLPAVVHATDDGVLPRSGRCRRTPRRTRPCHGVATMPRTSTPSCFIGTSMYKVPSCFFDVRVGAGQQEAVVGVMSLSGPHLLAVDDPLVAVEDGRGLQRCEIAARVRLRESLAPPGLTLQDPREEFLLLFLGAPLQDGRPDERVTEEVTAHRRLRPGELLGGPRRPASW